MSEFLRLSLTTAPTKEPFCIEEVKTLLGVEHTFHDDRIRSAMTTATEVMQGHAWRQFLQATYTLHLRSFLCGRGRKLYLPRPPLTSVTSVKYYDEDDADQTVDATNYYVHTFGSPGMIEFKDTYQLPTIESREDAVRIEFVCGVADASSLPSSVKEGLIFLIRFLYEHPDFDPGCSSMCDYPKTYQNMVSQASMRDERTVYI